MNATQLLAQFDRLAEAPNAVPRLRDLVLDLAVRGKLMEAIDEHEQVPSAYSSESSSDEFPQNWRVLNFGHHFDIQGGTQPPKSSFISEPRDGYVRLFQIRDLGERPVPTYISVAGNIRYCKEGEILVGRYGASVGKVFWAQDGAYNVAMAKVIYPATAYVSRFVFLLLKSSFFQQRLTEVSRSAQAGFNKGDLAEIDFPLPPLSEQYRIVTKVDELMALCEQLDAAQQERERRRERLAAASLQLLNQPAADTSPEAQREHARFHLHHLPRLTTRPEHIKAMRKTILNLAVRGRLVPQNKSEESAEELLGHIHVEKTRLVKSGALKKVNAINSIQEEEMLFPLPEGWKWVRIGDLLLGDSQNGYSKRPDDAVDGIPILRISAGTVRQDGVVAEEEFKLIGSITAAQRRHYEVAPGDLLACRFNGNRRFVGRISLYTGYLGNSPIYPDKLIRLRLLPGFILPELVRHFAESDPVRKDIEGYCATTVGNWGISAANMKEVKIPLPPLAEQHRIVAKVDELMALCDQLEANLTTTQTDSRRLLEAVLEAAHLP